MLAAGLHSRNAHGSLTSTMQRRREPHKKLDEAREPWFNDR